MQLVTDEKLTNDQLMELIARQNNVCTDLQMTLSVVKELVGSNPMPTEPLAKPGVSAPESTIAAPVSI